MPNIVIDQLQLVGWTGEAWQYNGRVTWSENTASFSFVSSSMNPIVLNPAARQSAIEAAEAGGSGTVGALDTKLLIGGFTTL